MANISALTKVHFKVDVSSDLEWHNPSFAAAMAEAAQSHNPVSYTHLDVYKRQDAPFLAWEGKFSVRLCHRTVV